MRYHRVVFVLFVSLLVATVLTRPSFGERLSGLSDEELAAGWIALFDGQTLYGWSHTGDANWHVADGTIQVDRGTPGLLCTTTQFADYALRVDFRAAADTNSGIFLRTSPEPHDPAADCYELNIAPADNPFPTGSLVARQKATPQVAADQWHTFEVTMRGGHVTVRLDGQQVLEYHDEKPLGRGYIGLQYRRGPVAFRNIRLRPLGLKDMFGAGSLEGWSQDETRTSVFSLTEKGELRVKNGPGQLESRARYGDFVLQVECLVNGDELNSGIFFRSIPGDYSMGYEAQIHNGMIDGDPTRPANGGTGGIFRRQEARRIVAADHQWFTMTVVADGPHMAAWVDGYQVSDWTDRRKPNENPRRGLRLAPGTIIIQGHDSTTDLLFRNLRIVEMATRS